MRPNKWYLLFSLVCIFLGTSLILITPISNIVIKQMTRTALHTTVNRTSKSKASFNFKKVKSIDTIYIKNISDPEQAFAQCYDVLYYLLPLMAIIANTYGLSWIDEGRKRVKEIAQHHERQI
uniref:hypothetical protein n=1 Tax=Lentilactobacillus hilgardii TaxID=1588 RepID=UPI00403FAC02